MISASELRSILEIHHLLRSPKNAERLLNTLRRAQSEKLPAQTIESLKKEVGIE
jgi:antitoxin YefM